MEPMRRAWRDGLPKGAPQLGWDQLSLDERTGYHKLRQRCTPRLKSANQFRQGIREIGEYFGSIRVRFLTGS
jgi:hypothetical protein